MKNQYFGDKRDLFKFDLVLHVMESVVGLNKFTYIPMLTPDDDRAGGRLTNYPRGYCRKGLFDFLQESVEGNRNIQRLREFFKKRPFAYNPYMDDSYYTHFERETYFRNIPNEALIDALIVLDPDIGLEIREKDDQHLHLTCSRKTSPLLM